MVRQPGQAPGVSGVGCDVADHGVGRAPEQLIRWEADYGWTRRGYGQVAEKETLLAVPLARLLNSAHCWSWPLAAGPSCVAERGAPSRTGRSHPFIGSTANRSIS
jgi:hypothetical protein